MKTALIATTALLFATVTGCGSDGPVGSTKRETFDTLEILDTYSWSYAYSPGDALYDSVDARHAQIGYVLLRAGWYGTNDGVPTHRVAPGQLSVEPLPELSLEILEQKLALEGLPRYEQYSFQSKDYGIWILYPWELDPIETLEGLRKTGLFVFGALPLYGPADN